MDIRCENCCFFFRQAWLDLCLVLANAYCNSEQLAAPSYSNRCLLVLVPMCLLSVGLFSQRARYNWVCALCLLCLYVCLCVCVCVCVCVRAGAPALLKTQQLVDRRRVLTQDTDGSVDMWDVFQVRCCSIEIGSCKHCVTPEHGEAEPRNRPSFHHQGPTLWRLCLVLLSSVFLYQFSSSLWSFLFWMCCFSLTGQENKIPWQGEL